MNISVPYHQLSRVEKIVLNAYTHKDILNARAIFSDETENYRTPVEPSAEESVAVFLRTAKDNVDHAYLCYCEEKLEMTIERTEGMFDYYLAVLPPCKETKYYYFEIVKNNVSYFYTKKGLLQYLDGDGHFKVIRNFKTPDWSKGAVIYQIYVDRFYNGDKSNDVKTNEYIYLGKPVQAVENWEQLPEANDVHNFYGGDLKGVIEKLDYLQDLGVEVIYFNPIFVSPSNHKYDIQDYDYVDPHIGAVVEDGGNPLLFEKFNNQYASMYIQRTTNLKNLEASNKLFCDLVKEAHRRGIRVILDGVFNHCGAFHRWLDKEGFYEKSGEYPAGAFHDKDSIYRDYFCWFENGTYDGWWGFDNHPKLNFENSPELCEYILNIGKKWVSPPYNADGWRLDVAADLGHSPEFNHKFWKEFRDAVKSANPDAIILAEHYGDPSSWLEGDQWDTIMNYDAFMEPVTWFLTGMEKHSDSYRGELYNNTTFFEVSMRQQMARFSIQSLLTSMNELSNHDHSRFLTRTNKKVGRIYSLGSKEADLGINKGIMKEAVLIQMTWPGAPTIYYGDEVGVTGWTDPDNRRTYPWGKEDKDLLAFHKVAIALRKQYSALKTGSLEFLYSTYGVISYARFDQEEKLVIIINNTEEVKSLEIPVWQAEISTNAMMETLLTSKENGFSVERKMYRSHDGKLSIAAEPYSGIVLRAL